MRVRRLFSGYSRRVFIRHLSAGMGSVLFTVQGMAFLSSCGADNNTKSTSQADNDSANSRKLGIALVGLGNYSSGQLAPALQETSNCYLSGIVTGTPEKAEKWKEKYKIPDQNIYNYDNFDSIADNANVDIVYVVLPNAMHAEYVVRAARAGKHVICEKPMAVTVEDCDRMISACRDAGKMLSIGYRLHFEPFNQEMMRLGTEMKFGPIIMMKAENGMSSTQGWRLDKELAGGGPLMDLGVYCIQGVRYTTGQEPVAVTAREGVKTKPEMFSEVEESLTWEMEMPGGIKASCMCSYTKSANLLRAQAKDGWFELSPAYAYSALEGKTSAGEMTFPEVNQQALQMDDFAAAILNNRPTPVPGEMGRQDVKIIQAVYEAMRTGKRVEIK